MDFKDRKIGLVVFGILVIMLGALCALMVSLMLFSVLATTALSEDADRAVNVGMMIPGTLVYILLAVWFIWMGIGSVLARRWARALLLVTSHLWLVTGIMAIILVLMIFPGMYDQMAENGDIPREMAVVITSVTIAFLGFVYIVMPGVLILFYGSKHVKATCEKMDPYNRWTDKCPLPVLAVSMVGGIAALYMPFMGFYGWAIPFFGIVFSGMAGAAVFLIAMFLLGYVAWGSYRLKIKAWWCGVVLIVAWAVSTIITLSHVSLEEYYEKMNIPVEQLANMEQYTMFQTSFVIQVCGLWAVAALAYMFYTRKYYLRPLDAPMDTL